jgi:hypothetical protein
MPKGDAGQKDESRFWGDWRAFLGIVFRPQPLLLFLAATAFLSMSYYHTNRFLAVSYALLASISVGLAGSQIAFRWLEHADRRLLNVRGKLAVLNLKVLLNCTGMHQRRTEKYLECSKSDPKRAERIYRVWIEETVEKFEHLYEQAVSSIETWSDIIPEANIRTEINRLNELTSRVAVLQSQKSQLEKQLVEKENESEQGISFLKDQLASTKVELERTKDQLKSAKVRIEGGVLSGISSSFGGFDKALRDWSTEYTKTMSTISGAFGHISPRLPKTELELRCDECGNGGASIVTRGSGKVRCLCAKCAG